MAALVMDVDNSMWHICLEAKGDELMEALNDMKQPECQDKLERQCRETLCVLICWWALQIIVRIWSRDHGALRNFSARSSSRAHPGLWIAGLACLLTGR